MAFPRAEFVRLDLGPLYTGAGRFVPLNLGVGYSSANGALRVEGFVSNLLDEDASTKALFQPSLNLRFLNDPRTMGVRLRYRF